MRNRVKRYERAPWLTALVEYEGYPMALRVRPGADTGSNRKKFSRSVRITHELACVKSNGLPEDDYNHALAKFDLAVLQMIEARGDGLVVLVETFSGRRIYYAYVDSTSTFKERFTKLTEKYPQHHLTVSNCIDTEWKTYKVYHDLFPWVVQ